MKITRSRRCRTALVLAATTGLLLAGSPFVAVANLPAAAGSAPVRAATAPPPFALVPVSGFGPDEDEVYVETMDIEADGAKVLYQVTAAGYRGVLAVRDRVAETTTYVDHRAGEPAQPPSERATAAAISANGGVVIFASGAYDLDPAGEPAQDEAWLRRLDNDELVELPRPVEAGAGNVVAVDISADASRAAVITSDDWSAEGAPGYTVYVLDLRGGEPSVGAALHLPAWAGALALSADGSTVAYAADTSADPETATTQMVVARADDLAPMLVRDDWTGIWSSGAISLDRTGGTIAYRGAGGTALVIDRAAPAAPIPVPVPAGAVVRNLQLSADGSTVVYDDALYDEGRLGASVWSVALPGGQPVRVAGTGKFVPDAESCEQEPCEELPSPYGVRAVRPVVSADGSVIALWLDGSAVAATRSAGALDTVSPTWPAGAALAAIPAAAATLRLSWPQATDDRALRAYEITADGRPLGTVAPSRTDYEVALASPTATVSYTVRAIDTSGNASVALELDTRGPGQISTDRTAPDSLTLEWERAARADVVGYRILRAPGGQQADGSLAGEGDFAPLVDVPADATGYADAGLPYLTHFDYRVQLVLDDGTVTWWTASATAHTDLPAPGPLTVEDARSNAMTLSWAPAPESVPLTGYRIQRQQQRPEREYGWTDVGTVDAGATTRFTDRGLAPRAQYLWRVVADLDNGWGPRDWTQQALGSTASEGITSWVVDAPRTADGVALVLDSDLTVTVNGEPGMQASLRLWQVSNPSAEQAPDVVLALGEVSPGNYRADPYRLDGREITALGKAEAVLTDGTRTFTRAGTVGPIGGRLDVGIAAAVDEVPGLQLVLRGPKGTQRLPASAPSQASVALSPGSWDVSLVTADGDVAAHTTTAITPAAVAAIDMAPVRHALLSVTVAAPAGQPLDAQSVVVTAGDGTQLAKVAVNQATGRASIAGLPARATVVVTTALADPKRPVSQQRVALTLLPGLQEVTLQTEMLPLARVRATVTGAGAPLAGAKVTVRQRIDGRDWTFAATTTLDGTAQVDTLAGPADVVAVADLHLRGGVPATLAAGADAAVAIDLLPTPAYVLRPRLITTNAGAEPVEQPLEWITATHLRASLTVAGRPVVLAPAVPVAANEGDTVQFCADGWERALGKACRSVVLGSAADVPVEIELTQAGVITADLRDADGKPVAGWSASSSRITANGSLDFGGYHRGSGNDATVGAATPGQYQIVFTSGAYRSAPITVGVANGSVVDLGIVTLGGDGGAAGGASLTALPEQVLPGGRITYRVTLPAGKWPNRTELRAAIPAGATALPLGVTVDGNPVTPRIADGVIAVPLTGAAEAVVRYALDVDAATAAGPLASVVRLVHDNGARTAELGTVLGMVSGVSVTGPRTVTSAAFRLTGTAPAGSTMRLLEGDTEVGRATAGAGGRWTAAVTLPFVRRGSLHAIHAVAQFGQVQLASETIQIGYDDRFLQPVRVEVDNSEAGKPGTRVIGFDPRLGVAAFTMVYRPGAPLSVRAVFADAGRVRNFVAHVGAAQAAGRCDATTCTAAVLPATSADVGDIWLDYDVDAAAAASLGAVPVPTEDQARHTVPAPFNDPREDDRAATGHTHTFRYRLGGTGMSIDAQVSIGDGPDYEPTARDAALLLRSGVPTHDLQVSGTPTTDGVDLHLHTLIPRDFLADAPQTVAGGRWVTALDIVFKIKAGLGVGVNQLHNVFGTSQDDDAYRALQDYIAETIEPCSPDIAAELYERLDLSRLTVLYYRGTSDALNSLGLLGGTWTSMAEGLVAAGAEAAIGESVDLGIGAMVDAEIADITGIVKNKPLCDKRIKWIPPTHKFPTAKPTWIYDPSGFVYEALETERLSGVIATVLQAPSADGPWTVWDAAAFGQTNPQSTTDDGRYGWDVPTGWWKVRYTKDGYRTAESDAMQVLPERYGVDVDLHPLAAPALVRADVADGGVAIGFDMWMQAAAVVAGVRLTDAVGVVVAGTVVPVDVRTSPGGISLAREFRFVPGAALPTGAQLRLTVAGATVDHGGVSLGADAVRTLTVPGTPPSPGQQVLSGFDQLAAAQGLNSRVAKELRAAIELTVVFAEKGHKSAARAALTVYGVLVLTDARLWRVNPTQAAALRAYAAKVTKALQL